MPESTRKLKVKEVATKLAVEGDWQALSEYDVVVATPNCTSPALEGVCVPPAGLFDIVVIDEAHHSPAKTWAELLNQFKTVKCILFTATPFRRDKKLIHGKLVFNYPL